MPSQTPDNVVPIKPRKGSLSDPDTELSKDLLATAEYAVATMAHTPYTTNEITIEEPIKGTAYTRTWQITVQNPKIGHTIAGDQDIYMAVMFYLQRGRFEDPYVRVSRYEICKLLGWKPNTQRYDQITGACQRFMNVQFTSKNAFMDPETGERFGEIGFRVVDSYAFFDKSPSSAQLKRMRAKDPLARGMLQESLPLNYMRISEEFLLLCRHTGKKMIDLGFYRSLSRPEVRWLYRFLDKNLHRKPEYRIGLRKLRLRQGLVEPLADKYIKRKLKPRLQELQDSGFLSFFDFEKVGAAEDPWHLVVRPGPQFHASRGKRHRKESNPRQDAQVTPGAHVAPNTRGVEDALVRYWRESRGITVSGAISRADRRTAQQLLDQLEDVAEAKRAIDFAISVAAKTGFTPESFSYVLQNNYPERSRQAASDPTNATTADQAPEHALVHRYNAERASHLDAAWSSLAAADRETAIAAATATLTEKYADKIATWPKSVLSSTAERHARNSLASDFESFDDWLSNQKNVPPSGSA